MTKQVWEPVIDYRIKCACEHCAPLSTSPFTTGDIAWYMDTFPSPNNPGKTGAFIHDGKSETHIVFPEDVALCRLVPAPEPAAGERSAIAGDMVTVKLTRKEVMALEDATAGFDIQSLYGYEFSVALGAKLAAEWGLTDD